MKERGSKIVNHKLKPEDSNEPTPSFPREIITEEQFKVFLEALSDGASTLTAAQYARTSKSGMLKYIKRSQSRGDRVMRARADWKMFHLRRLSNIDDDASGSSSRVRASLGALASVDKRYRKDVHVGATINNTLVLADPRPPGTIGNPERYSLKQADATVIEPATPTPTAEIAQATTTPAPLPPTKPGPII